MPYLRIAHERVGFRVHVDWCRCVTINCNLEESSSNCSLDTLSLKKRKLLLSSNIILKS